MLEKLIIPAHPVATAEQQTSPLAGIAFLVMGLSIFSIQDVIVRSLSGTLPALEITFIRGLVALIPLMIILKMEGGFHLMKTRHPVFAIVRGLLGLVSFLAYYLALASLTMADAVTLFYSSPLFVTAMSVFLLREQVGPFRTLVYAGHDWANPELSLRSMELMANEVMPRVNQALGHDAAAAE